MVGVGGRGWDIQAVFGGLVKWREAERVVGMPGSRIPVDWLGGGGMRVRLCPQRKRQNLAKILEHNGKWIYISCRAESQIEETPFSDHLTH